MTTSSAIVRTSSETDETKALEYMEYIDLSTVDKELSSEFNEMSDSAKKNTIKRVITAKPQNFTEYIKAFEEACFLQKIQDEQYSSNLTKYLNDYKSKFSFDLNGYDSVSAKVNPKLCGKEYLTMSDFKKELEEAIKDAEKGSGGGSGSSSGSGGGGGRTPSSDNKSDVTINNPTAPEQTQTTNFDDLDSVTWAKESIEKLANMGIISGKEERRFYPNDVIKREEFVKIMVSAFELEDDAAEVSFADVPGDSWFYKYVASAVNAGLVYGIDENHFGAGIGITRQDLASIIYRYLLSSGEEFSSETNLFADDDKIADYAREAVYALKAKGTLSGTDNNNFEPQRQATRAESAKIIAMILEV